MAPLRETTPHRPEQQAWRDTLDTCKLLIGSLLRGLLQRVCRESPCGGLVLERTSGGVTPADLLSPPSGLGSNS